MSELVWTPGSPTEDGFYWFDSGWKRPGLGQSITEHPLLLEIRKGYRLGYGPYGSGPFDGYFFHKSMESKCRHAKIPDPKKWGNLSLIKEKHTYSWFKDDKGYLGFAILQPDVHNDVGGTWIYIDHPTCAADHGRWVYGDEGYQFSPVKIPEI